MIARRLAHRGLAAAALVLAGALAAGCAPIGTIRVPVPAVESVGFGVQDARPAEMRRSRLVASGANLVEVYGDDRIAPQAPALVASTLQARFGERLRGAQVVLAAFELVGISAASRIDMSKFRNVVDRSQPGVDPIAPTPAGGLGAEAAPTKFVAQIIGTVNGRRFAARGEAVSPFASDEDAALAVTRALEGVVADIRRGLAGS